MDNCENVITQDYCVSCLTSQVLNEKPLLKGDKIEIIEEVEKGGQVVAIQDR